MSEVKDRKVAPRIRLTELVEENKKLRAELLISKSDNDTLKNIIVKMLIDKYGY